MDLDNEEIEATRNLKVKGSDIDVDSIEEAIWRCKELIKPVHINWIGGMNQNAIEILLGNLEALSDMQNSANREIKELRKKVKELEKYEQMYLDEVDKHVDTILIYNSLLKRIENKIKELKTQRRELGFKKYLRKEDFTNDDKIIMNQISILEELLQESEDK